MSADRSHVSFGIKTSQANIPYSEIQALAFTGRDTAAGRSWEAWLRKYWQKKTAGEHHIQRDPEALE